MKTSSPWILAIGSAALIHLALAQLLLSPSAIETDGASAEGNNGLEVGIGLSGSYAELQVRTSPQPKPRVAARPERSPATAPEPVAKATPVPVEPALPDTAFEQSKPDSPLQESTTPTTKASTSATAEVTDAKPEHSAEPTNSTIVAQQRATGSGEQRRAGGKPGAARTYFTELSAWLNRHKTYPITAKKEKQEGTVKLQFTIHRNGEISDARLRASSGHPLLDQSALQMLAAASPLPALPDSLGREQISIVIPVEYSLITNASFKE